MHNTDETQSENGHKAATTKGRDVAERPLTVRNELFITHYLETSGNGTQAARLAGYEGDDATLAVMASRLLANPTIAQRISADVERLSLTKQQVLAELTDIATADWKEHLQVRTNPRTGETIEAKILLSDKVKALELIGRYHNMWTDTVNVNETVIPKRYIDVDDSKL